MPLALRTSPSAGWHGRPLSTEFKSREEVSTEEGGGGQVPGRPAALRHTPLFSPLAAHASFNSNYPRRFYDSDDRGALWGDAERREAIFRTLAVDAAGDAAPPRRRAGRASRAAGVQSGGPRGGRGRCA